MESKIKHFFCPDCESEVSKLPTTSYKEKGKVRHIPHYGRARCDKCGWKSEPYGKGLIQK